MLVCALCGEEFFSLEDIKEHLREYHKVETQNLSPFIGIDPEVLTENLRDYLDDDVFDEVEAVLNDDGLIRLKFKIQIPCVFPSRDMEVEMAEKTLAVAYAIVKNLPFGRFAGIVKEKESDDYYTNCYYVIVIDGVKIEELV